MADDRVVKFCTQAMSSLSIWMTKGHVTRLNLGPPNDMSGMVEARIVRFCTRVDCIKCQLLDDKPLKGAWSGSYDSFLILMLAVIFPKWLKR